MLSILIPVYNQNVCSLVTTLKKQAKELGVAHEIILIDDASDEVYRKENRCLSRIEGVSYVELTENEGQAAVRNMLAEAAGFPYLLFMDGDAGVEHPGFLQSYVDHCLGEVVVCGGTMYPSHPPADCTRLLRWKYGVGREMVPAARRRKHPYASFSSFNFLAAISVMKKIRFGEMPSRYGHEDTLFGFHLAKEKIPVKHIDNPLVHTGLDTNAVFLAKTREASRSLAILSLQYRLDRDFARSVKLVRWYNRLYRLGLLRPFLGICSLFSRQIEQNLLGRHPSLFLFQLFKLRHYHGSLMEEGRRSP